MSKAIAEDPRHIVRYLKAQVMGGSEEAAATAIAKSEGVSMQTVLKSIRQVDTYRKKNDRIEFDYAVRSMVIDAIQPAKAALNGLLNATELVEMKDAKSGKTKVVKQEDKTTRLEALRVLNSLMIGLQPKTPMIEQNITQTQQNQTAVLQAGAGETTEERLRRLRKQAQEHRMLPPEVAAVPSHIDAGFEGGGDDEGDEEDEE